MHERKGAAMKEMAYFVLGAAVGAMVALLYAPKSGKELRADIQGAAEKDLSQLQAEWQSTMVQVNQRLDQMHADLKQASQQVPEEESEGADST
jgi:gas vesicle protein